MKKYGFLFLFLLLLTPFSVHGRACSNQEQVKYSSMANNIMISPQLIQQNGTVTFQLMFLNVSSDLKLVDARTDQEYSSSTIVLGNFQPNTSYRFRVIPRSGGCWNTTVRTIYYTTPGYNPYYQDPICKGIEGYSLCQRFNQVNLSYEEFQAKINEYKETLNHDVTKEEPEPVKGIYDYLLDIFIHYYFIILPVFIIGLSIVIFRLRKKEEFF